MAKESKITRITASDTPRGSAPKAAKALKGDEAKEAKVVKATKVKKPKSGKKNIFQRIGGYFKGAWQELRQVRWPSRQATWALTLAVILFSAFLLVLILALDAFFKYLFQLIIA